MKTLCVSATDQEQSDAVTAGTMGTVCKINSNWGLFVITLIVMCLTLNEGKLQRAIM